MRALTKKRLIDKTIYKEATSHDQKSITVDEFIHECFGDFPQWAIALRGLRNREGLTQQQLGQAIGVEQSNLSKMEHGKRQVGLKIAKRIGKAFNTDYHLFV